MIKITYEYICDICEGSIGTIDEYQLNAHMAVPSPRQKDNYCGKNLCEDCMEMVDKAIAHGIKEWKENKE